MVPDLNDPSPLLAPVPVFVPAGPRTTGRHWRPGPRPPSSCCWPAPRTATATSTRRSHRGTRLKWFRYAEDVATVNLTRGFAAPTGSGQLRIGQVFWTVNRPAPDGGGPDPGRGPPGQDSRPRPVPGRPDLDAPGRAAGRDVAPALPGARERLGPVRAPRRDLLDHPQAWPVATSGRAERPQPQVGPHPVPGLPLDGVCGRHRHRADPLAGRPRRQGLPGRRAVGRLSAPTWSPDSKRVYVVARDETGTRLVEVRPQQPGRPPAPARPLPLGPRAGQRHRQPRRDLAARRRRPPRPQGRGGRARPRRPAVPRPARPRRRHQLVPAPARPRPGPGLQPDLGRPGDVAFVAETDNKDDLGKLWTIKSDGWDPTAVLNDSDVAIGDIGNRSPSTPPAGRSWSPPAPANGASLWMINRQDKSVSLPHPPHPQRLRQRPQLRQPLTAVGRRRGRAGGTGPWMGRPPRGQAWDPTPPVVEAPRGQVGGGPAGVLDRGEGRLVDEGGRRSGAAARVRACLSSMCWVGCCGPRCAWPVAPPGPGPAASVACRAEPDDVGPWPLAADPEVGPLGARPLPRRPAGRGPGRQARRPAGRPDRARPPAWASPWPPPGSAPTGHLRRRRTGPRPTPRPCRADRHRRRRPPSTSPDPPARPGGRPRPGSCPPGDPRQPATPSTPEGPPPPCRRPGPAGRRPHHHRRHPRHRSHHPPHGRCPPGSKRPSSPHPPPPSDPRRDPRCPFADPIRLPASATRSDTGQAAPPYRNRRFGDPSARPPLVPS
jgi:hypothetical protein